MKIDQLLLRTMKSDHKNDAEGVETLIERAGFIKKKNGSICYSMLGVMIRHRIKEMIKDFLYKEGFSEISISGRKNLILLNDSIHDFISNFPLSYKDIPLKIYTEDEIGFRNHQYASLWKAKDQEIIAFSTLGEHSETSGYIIDRLMEKLELPYVEDGGGYYYPSNRGMDRYKEEDSLLREETIKTDENNKETGLKLVHTPDIRTVDTLAGFLEARPEEIIKTMLYTDGDYSYAVLVEGDKDVDTERVTRILGIKEDALTVMPKDQVEEVTGAKAGFAGPKDLKVDRMIIDSGIRKDQMYIAGANMTDYHYSGILYGRDFSGDFYSVTERSDTKRGWVVGETRVHPEKIRVQGLNGKFDYHSLETTYINVDRLFLAISQQSLDEIGFDYDDRISCFEAVVAVVDRRDEASLETGVSIYEHLKANGIRVLLDDRKDRMGSKFYDYDLIGIAMRIIVGKNGEFDVKNRYGDVKKATFNNIVEIVRSKVIE